MLMKELFEEWYSKLYKLPPSESSFLKDEKGEYWREDIQMLYEAYCAGFAVGQHFDRLYSDLPLSG